MKYLDLAVEKAENRAEFSRQRLLKGYIFTTKITNLALSRRKKFHSYKISFLQIQLDKLNIKNSHFAIHAILGSNRKIQELYI